MSFIGALLQIVLLLLSPLLQLKLGQIILFKIISWVKRESDSGVILEEEIPKVLAFVFGLLLHLLCIVLLASLGLPLSAAVVLPLFLPVLRHSSPSDFLSGVRFKVSWNFLLWFFVILALGISLFNVSDKISTPWVNNYGDLTFHMGMITSFVFGKNFPPQYHIFPGSWLSYSFFINLWSASFWSFHPTFTSLCAIFAFQWVVVWIVVYYSLNGDRWKLLPWAALFGGGAFLHFFQRIVAEPGSPYFEKAAHEFLAKGYPWTPFLTTIWVTQRTTLLGMCVILPVLGVFHAFLKKSSSEKNPKGLNTELLLASIVLVLAPLTHFHFFLGVSGYIVLVLALGVLQQWFFGARSEKNKSSEQELTESWNPNRLITACREFWKRRKDGAESVQKPFPITAYIEFLSFFLPLLLLAALPLLWLSLGKTGIMEITWGWMPWPKPQNPTMFVSLAYSAKMWFRNATAWFVFVIALYSISKKELPFLALLLLFLFGNFVQLAVWDWDQLKFFLALYLISLSLLAALREPLTFWQKAAVNYSLLMLIIPGFYEFYTVLAKYSDFTVYSTEDLKQAETVRNFTEPKAVILAAPDHNSPITLTGRPLFSGYEGTTHSHGLPYGPRKQLMEKLENIKLCPNRLVGQPGATAVCPKYLFWSEREKRYWKKQKPGDDAVFKILTGEVLYKIEMPE